MQQHWATYDAISMGFENTKYQSIITQHIIYIWFIIVESRNFNKNILPKITGRKTYVQLMLMICWGVKTFDSFITPIWLKAEGLKMTCDWLSMWKILWLFAYQMRCGCQKIEKNYSLELIYWPEFHYISILD